MPLFHVISRVKTICHIDYTKALQFVASLYPSIELCSITQTNFIFIMFLINLPIEFITFVLTSLAHSLIFLTPFVKFFLDHVDRPCSVPVFNTLGLMITRFSTRMMFYQLVFLTITGLVPLVVLYPLLIIALTVTRKSLTYCTSYVRSAEEVPELQDGRDLSDKLKFLEKALWNSKHIPLTNLLSTFFSCSKQECQTFCLVRDLAVIF